MGKFHKGIPEKLALELKDKYRLRHFVETGTHVGRTAFWAARYFETVFTIEQSAAWYKKARRNCSGVRNIHILHARSQEILWSILLKTPTPALIWLDAHWSRDLGYNPGDCINPVIEELKHIEHDGRNHVVMVDDARLFGKEHGWPTAPELLLAMCYDDRNVMVLEDVYISIPCQQ